MPARAANQQRLQSGSGFAELNGQVSLTPGNAVREI